MVSSLANDINVELKELQKQKHRYIQGDKELKNAITNISHDLRTPLTTICGYLSLLDKEEKSEHIARQLSIIKNRTFALKQLVEELFRYTTIISDTENSVYTETVMRMFQKAGYFDKKLAFVPILNEYLVFRLAGVQKEFLLYLVSSLVSWLLHFNRSLILAAAGAGIFALILRIYMAYELAKHYGTGKLMAAGIVCFPALAYLILGYGKHIYKK